MARFEQEYCLCCTNNGGPNCAIPTKPQRVANAAAGVVGEVAVVFARVSGRAIENPLHTDYYEETRFCADERLAAEVQATDHPSEDAVVLWLPFVPKPQL